MKKEKRAEVKKEEELFGKHSLVLEKEGEVVFSSDKPGLRPLWECVNWGRGRYKGCVLYDKVVGLAGGRLIAYSGMVEKVVARVVSESGERFLVREGVLVEAREKVEVILNKDKTGPCLQELKAERVKGRREFFRELGKVFSVEGRREIK